MYCLRRPFLRFRRWHGAKLLIVLAVAVGVTMLDVQIVGAILEADGVDVFASASVQSMAVVVLVIAPLVPLAAIWTWLSARETKSWATLTVSLTHDHGRLTCR